MNNHLGRTGTNELSLFSLNYISFAFTQCCPSSVSPSRCLRWSPSWRITSVSTSVACELTYRGRRCILTGLETAQLSITELKMVSANPTPPQSPVTWHPLLRNSPELSPFSMFSLPTSSSVSLKVQQWIPSVGHVPYSTVPLPH